MIEELGAPVILTAEVLWHNKGRIAVALTIITIMGFMSMNMNVAQFKESCTDLIKSTANSLQERAEWIKDGFTTGNNEVIWKTIGAYLLLALGADALRSGLGYKTITVIT